MWLVFSEYSLFYLDVKGHKCPHIVSELPSNKQNLMLQYLDFAPRDHLCLWNCPRMHHKRFFFPVDPVYFFHLANFARCSRSWNVIHFSWHIAQSVQNPVADNTAEVQNINLSSSILLVYKLNEGGKESQDRKVTPGKSGGRRRTERASKAGQ